MPGWKSLSYLTYGELLLMTPFLFLLFAGYYYTFTSPNAYSSGTIASLGLLLVFFTANKSNSIFHFILGIPFERLIGFHKSAACVTIILSILHAYAAWERDVARGKTPTLTNFPYQDGFNTSGSFLTLAMILLVATSLFSFFRRRAYDIWLATHIGLIAGVFIGCMAHGVAAGIIGAIWWLVDVAIRYVVMARCRYPTTATVRRLRPDVIEIRFPKPQNFHYKPGQFLRLSVSRLSSLQFHPFSISSAPHEEEVTLHARALGDWTRRLLQLVPAGQTKDIEVWLEGPYGNASMDVNYDEHYRMVLCVSGGIGVTHCRSVARSILHNHQYNGRRLEQLRFVWAVRDLGLVKDLPPFGGMSNEFKVSEDMASYLPVVQTEIYQSNSKSRDDVENRNINGDNRQLNGRPDLAKILAEMRDVAVAKGVTHIAVFGCGPQSLMDSLKQECRRNSKSLTDPQGVSFDVHVEVFEF